MIDERERDWVADEIAEIEARRERIVTARDGNPHLAHHSTAEQIRILDRQLAELREAAS